MRRAMVWVEKVFAFVALLATSCVADGESERQTARLSDSGSPDARDAGPGGSPHASCAGFATCFHAGKKVDAPPDGECCAVTGSRFDEALGCRARESETFGCVSGYDERPCGSEPAEACLMGSGADGARVVVHGQTTWYPPFAAARGWQECDEALASAVVPGRVCD